MEFVMECADLGASGEEAAGLMEGTDHRAF